MPSITCSFRTPFAECAHMRERRVFLSRCVRHEAFLPDGAPGILARETQQMPLSLLLLALFGSIPQRLQFVEGQLLYALALAPSHTFHK